jgi:hypothetical protein
MSDPSDVADLGLGLDDLIRLVDSARADGDPIDRLGTAVRVAQRLGDLGDHLIGYFVDQARASGASWQAIGAGMGVTKQAAQQRFVPPPGEIPEGGLLSRFAPRARSAVVTAREEARRLGSPEVRPEHLLIGLVADPEALAAKALAAQGVGADEIRRKVEAGAAPPSGDELPDRIPYSASARKVLEIGVREALRLAHNYIGTEHLLLAMLRERGSVANRVLDELGVSASATGDWLRRELAELVARKTS